ncbi:MAG: hypothetical protein Q4G42_00455 [Neisseria sp.]|nr:hypothetical protein [Neisseria sp.]
MKIEDIPQDNSKTYDGHQKVIYATRGGQYVKSTSTGWEDEAYATEQAVADLDDQAQEAAQAVRDGRFSVLYYCMYRYRYDIAGLAAAAGLFRWQVRRHLQPRVFARLPEKTLRRYAAAFNIDDTAFRQPETLLPTKKEHHS